MYGAPPGALRFFTVLGNFKFCGDLKFVIAIFGDISDNDFAWYFFPLFSGKLEILATIFSGEGGLK